MAAGASGKPVCEACRTFTPHFHPERLPQMTAGTGHRVFIGSMCDLWSDGVLPEWRAAIWERVRAARQNAYIVLTKRPERINPRELDPYDDGTLFWPPNLWVGTSITGDDYRADIPRMIALAGRVSRERRILSVEPLRGDVYLVLQNTALVASWLIAGPQTGPGAVAPEREWVDQLIHYADAKGIPLWLKDGCYKLWPDLPLRQELPADMARLCARGGQR
jgi:protein gp37